MSEMISYKALNVDKVSFKEQMSLISTSTSEALFLKLLKFDTLAAKVQMKLLERKNLTVSKLLASHSHILPRTCEEIIKQNRKKILPVLAANPNLNTVTINKLSTFKDVNILKNLVLNPILNSSLRDEVFFKLEKVNFNKTLYYNSLLSVDFKLSESIFNVIIKYFQGLKDENGLIRQDFITKSAPLTILKEALLQNEPKLIMAVLKTGYEDFTEEDINYFLSLNYENINAFFSWGNKINESQLKHLVDYSYENDSYKVINGVLANHFKSLSVKDCKKIIKFNFQEFEIEKFMKVKSNNFTEFYHALSAISFIPKYFYEEILKYDKIIKYVDVKQRTNHYLVKQTLLKRDEVPQKFILEAFENLEENAEFIVLNKTLTVKQMAELSKFPKTHYDLLWNENLKLTEDFSWQFILFIIELQDSTHGNDFLSIEIINQIMVMDSEFLEAFNDWTGSLKELIEIYKTV